MKKLTLLALALPLAVTLGVNEANAGIGIHGSLALPMGNFGDVAGMGFGGGASWERELNENITYAAKVSYLTFGEENKITTTMIPVMGQTNYYFGDNEDMRFYGSFSAGYYFINLDADGGASVSDNKVGFALGGGMKMKSLDFSAQYNLVDGSNFSFLGVNVGYNF